MSAVKEKGPLVNAGICRCCGSTKKCRLLNANYEFEGAKEVYSDMIMDCFGLLISHLDSKVMERLICATCVVRLREARNFKTQVLQCEEAFLKMKMYDDDNMDIIKKEILDPADNESFGNLADNDIGDNMYNIDIIKKEILDPTDNESLGNLADNDYMCVDNDTLSEVNDAVILHVQNYNVHDIKPNVKLEIEVNEKDLKNTNTCSNESDCYIKPRTVDDKDPNQEEKLAIRKDMIHNINIIIQNSTVLPFRYTSRSYLCFYCPNKFTYHGLLRTHTLQHTNYPNLTKHVRTQLQTKLVYVDVTDLSCKLCLKKIENYPTLREHLANVHKFKFKHVQEGIVPFKLRDDDSSFECQICGNNFISFNNLSIHLNEHYEYCTCETCGASYLSKARLLQHQKVSGHLIDPQNVINQMESGVIKKRHKCRCGKVFKSNYLKRKHEIYDHNMKSKFHECQKCDMKFFYSSSLKRHVRITHLKEKINKCPVCGKGFYSKKDLLDHSVVHTGEKRFTCNICFKSLGQRKSLFNHFLMHNGEFRYICDYCGKGFIQKSNLVYHMRKQHAKGEKIRGKPLQ